MNKILSNLKIPFFIFAIFVSSNVQSQCETLTFSYALDGATSNQYCTDNSGWHHFYDSNDEVILSVQGNFAGAPAGYPIVSISVNPSYFQANEETGTTPGLCSTTQLSPGEERFEMARSWNIDFGGGSIIPPYNLRFYYKPEERQVMETAAANFINAYPVCNYTYKYPYANGFYWFKNTGNYVAPQLDGVHQNGTLSTTNGINYVELNGVVDLSGGGSGAIILLESALLGEYQYYYVEYNPPFTPWDIHNLIGVPFNSAGDFNYFYGTPDDWRAIYNGGTEFSIRGDITNIPEGYPKIGFIQSPNYYQENESLTYEAADCANGFSPGEQRFQIESNFSIDFGPGAIINAPYEVIFYHDHASRIAMETAAANFINAYPDCGYTYKYTNPNGLYWFETANINYTTPEYDGTHVNYTHGNRILETSRPPNIEHFNYNYVHITGITGTDTTISAAIILTPNENTLSISENDFLQKIRVYPNPTYGNLSIELEQHYSKINIEVYNLKGQLVIQKEELDSDNIQLTIDNSAGIYFAKILTSDGQKTTIKVLKK